MVMSIVIFSAYINIAGVDIFPDEHSGLIIADSDRADDIRTDENYTKIEQEISIYISEAGSYVIVLPPDMGKLWRDRVVQDFPWVVFILLVVVVFFTNLILTRVISRRIMSSLKTLADGVHQISDGNLTYRIDQKTGDEFDAVCADFNEMASRLSDMVYKQQADENNRKELIAGISHDLRTPLTSIKAYIEGLKKGIATTPEMQSKYINTIQSKTEDLEHIIRQLFMFSKMDIGEFPFNFETVDIGKELLEIIDGLTDEYKERGLEIELLENVQGEYALIDVVSFRNVLQNILGNTIKYGDKNNSRAEIICSKNDNSISITISDNGPGVHAESLAKLFDVFYRGDISRNNPSKGSGLGLAISAKIIHRMKGTINASNKAEGGLNIHITLPIVEGECEYEKDISNRG
jgi:signal transduction histidine kinase